MIITHLISNKANLHRQMLLRITRSLTVLLMVPYFLQEPCFSGDRVGLISVGEKAPAFVTMDLDGKQYDMNEYIGNKVILMNFFTTWCGRCNWESKGMNKVYEELKERVAFVRVNLQEKKSKIKEFVKKYAIPFPVLPDEDGKVCKLYGVKYVPANIIIGADGVVKFSGGLLSEDDLRQRLNAVLEK